ncbi:MAG: hypothetical protein K8R77_08915 [Anaerolineaceae bacterium]|nr:hypothetical protein [Anaerolineaceae bacterium]
MSRGTGKRKFHHKDIRPKDPNIQRFSEWMGENRNFYAHFRRWMKENSYSASTIKIYSVAARQAIGYLRLPYWKINPEDDLQRFWAYLQDRGLTDSSLEGYRKGLNCFRDYLYLRRRKKRPPKQINWDYYLSGLPGWIEEHVRDYHRLCTRGWPPDQVFRSSTCLLSPLTQVLRFIHAREPLKELEQIKPERWFERLDERLREGRAVDTVNGELGTGFAMRVPAFHESRRLPNLRAHAACTHAAQTQTTSRLSSCASCSMRFSRKPVQSTKASRAAGAWMRPGSC